MTCNKCNSKQIKKTSFVNGKILEKIEFNDLEEGEKQAIIEDHVVFERDEAISHDID